MENNKEVPMIPKHQHQAEMMHMSRAVILWDYLHEKHIETVTRIRIKQGMYKV